MSPVLTSEDVFRLGSISGLEAFRAQLVVDRGRIENETDPAVDVILDLLDRVIERLRALEAELEP